MTLPSPFSILHRDFLTCHVSKLPLEPAVLLGSAATLEAAVQALRGSSGGCLLIGDLAGEVAAILTDRDLLNKVSLQHLDPVSTLALDIATKEPQTLRSNASVARLLHLMSSGGFRHVPIVYGAGKPAPVASISTFIDYIYSRLTRKLVSEEPTRVVEDTLVDKFFVSDISVLKPSPPVSISERASMEEALRLMLSRNVGSLVATSANGGVRGILTERDFVWKVAFKNVDLGRSTVGEFMTHDPRTALSGTTVSFAFNLMSEGGYRHIPVVDTDERLIGMLSARNFVDYLSASIVSDLS